MSTSSKILIGILAALAGVLLLLIVGSGACSSGGGGGMSSVGLTDSSTDTDQSSLPIASEKLADGGNSSPMAGAISSGSESYESVRERLKEKLERKDDPVGTNARSAVNETGLIPTVSEAYEEMADRGFGDDMTLFASFTMEGKYISLTELDRTSTEQYPSYRAEYASKNGILWTLAINEGRVYAVPTAAKNGSISKEIVLSEGDVVTQYDGKTNQYSDFAFSDLDASDAIALKVSRIDSSTLDSYTLDDLLRV